MIIWGCPCGLRPWVGLSRSSLFARPCASFAGLVWPSATAAHPSAASLRSFAAALPPARRKKTGPKTEEQFKLKNFFIPANKVS
ncbi:hypothetical protein SapgrDRAFT_2677 [Saprospira grandis DSM 2844]|uniref:Uncharacterized protein n=1 Tax=Saprospira grandis DSM 2844 TaxID=694433 RepID=J1I7D2_9BACT|nr:hypothetical protein SapgrDRAFT_2677 [Saprospira grandis DSM 2844]